MEMRISARNRTAQAFGEVRAELQRTGMAMTGLQRTTAAIGSAISMVPRIFGAAFAGIGVTELTRGIMDATREVAELGRQAKASGVSFEAFQELQYVFEKVHIEVSSLGQGLREMQDKAVEFAQTGGGRAADALKAIGYDAKSTAEALKDPEEMFKQIIDRLGDLDRASQIRFLGDIFGSADGDKFLKLLELGKEGIEDLGDAAKENGRILGDEMVEAAQRADAAWTEWGGNLQAWWRNFSVSVVGFLAQMPEPGQPISRSGGKGALSGSAATSGLMSVPATPAINMRGWRAEEIDGQAIALGTTRSTFDFRDTLDSWEKSQLEYGGVSTSIDKAAASLKAFDLGIDQVTPKVDTLADSVADELAGAFTGLFSTLRQGGSVFDYLIGKAGSLADQLLESGLQTGLRLLLGGINFGGAPSFAGSPFSFGGPSFDGGGYTGDGASAGGLDGKGGFLAMVHPRETIVDHSKGQDVGGMTVNVIVNAPGAQRGAGEEIAGAVSTQLRLQLPGMLQRLQRNPDRR